MWNDILDREYDRQVGKGCVMSNIHSVVRLASFRLTERTKHRPIADGRVSVPGALVFLAIHLVCLLALLWPVNALAYVHLCQMNPG